jgi:hypothetical protein
VVAGAAAGGEDTLVSLGGGSFFFGALTAAAALAAAGSAWWLRRRQKRAPQGRRAPGARGKRPLTAGAEAPLRRARAGNAGQAEFRVQNPLRRK